MGLSRRKGVCREVPRRYLSAYARHLLSSSGPVGCSGSPLQPSHVGSPPLPRSPHVITSFRLDESAYGAVEGIAGGGLPHGDVQALRSGRSVHSEDRTPTERRACHCCASQAGPSSEDDEGKGRETCPDPRVGSEHITARRRDHLTGSAIVPGAACGDG